MLSATTGLLKTLNLSVSSLFLMTCACVARRARTQKYGFPS